MWFLNIFFFLFTRVLTFFWVPACEPKCCWFDFQSRHMPELRARSLAGGVQEATTHGCFSPSLSPSLPLPLKLNKQNLKKKDSNNFFKLLILEREKHQFVVPLICAFIGCFLYVPWPRIEPATLAYWDNTLTNWASLPEPIFMILQKNLKEIL